MTTQRIKEMLDLGENIKIEFKRAGNGIENDTYETVCAFLNRFGGDILLGVTDNGEVVGVPPRAAQEWIKNFIKQVCDPHIFSPTTYIQPSTIEYEGKTLIHIHVNPSADVHSYKGVTYDRVNEADVRVKGTDKVALMWIRKQNIFTERKVFKYVSLEDMRLDLMPKIKQLAINWNGGKHPWGTMSDEEILKSAGFFGVDRANGERGMTLAGIMLLGNDFVIKDVTNGYLTDAILRKENIDRFDDRLIVETNLVESYEQLQLFAYKHLPDPYFLEGIRTISLRAILTKEIISNLLIHREFTSAYPAKFVIERDKMYTQNANRASGLVEITPDNFEPNPKNPIIASFFRTIGYADNLGSGVRNLFKYAQHYQHSRPEMLELDIFRTTVYFKALDELGAGLHASNPHTNNNPHINQHINPHINIDPHINPHTKPHINPLDIEIIKMMANNSKVTVTILAETLEKDRSTIRDHIKGLAEQRIISRTGAKKNGSWIVNYNHPLLKN